MTSPRKLRVAIALWLALGFAVWNVVFDRVIVLAGRRYVSEAALAVRAGRPYVLIDERMPAAVANATKLATAAGGTVSAAGLLGIFLARRRERHSYPAI